MGLFDSVGGWIGGALGGLGNIAGSLINANSQSNANQANVNLWREQAAYNAPAEQMQRLTAAGLNPNLVYGQVATSRMADAPTMQPVQYGNAVKAAGDSIMDYFQLRNLDAQNELIRAQKREVDARAQNVNENTRYQKYENDSFVGSGAMKSDPSILRQLRFNSLINSLYGKDWWKQLKQDVVYPFEYTAPRR